MQVADIDARSVPELCVETLRRFRIDMDSGGRAQTKMRKQPHAQYKSLGEFGSARLALHERGCLTRRAKQAQI
jgi:hypothetical protein